MWTWFKRISAYLALAVTLFACMYVSRVFLTARIVEWLMPEPSYERIMLVAIVDGLLPALILGIPYGLLAARPVVWKALAIALGAAMIELSLQSWQLSWWLLPRTWWVLPLECLALVVFFPAAAWAAAQLRRAPRAAAG